MFQASDILTRIPRIATFPPNTCVIELSGVPHRKTLYGNCNVLLLGQISHCVTSFPLFLSNALSHPLQAHMPAS
jgi:hypothetical protein